MTMNLTGKELAEDWAKGLIKTGFKEGWMLVVYDLHAQEERPEYVKPEEDIKERVREYQRVGAEEVLEVYNLGYSLGPQLAAAKAWSL